MGPQHHQHDQYAQTPTTGRGTYRRDVMKLVGAGTALGVVGGAGGVAVADEHESEDGDEDDGAVVGNTVHVVRTLIQPSTNPERPADFFYQPTGLHVNPGDVVKFVFETPDHTVTSYHPAFGMQRRLPPGVGPISSPLLGWDPNSLPDDIVMPPAENGGEETSDGANSEDTEADDESGEDDTGDENGTDDEGHGPPQPSTWLYAFETPGVYDLECAPHESFGMAMRVVVGEETETAFETSDTSQLPPPRAGPVGLARQVLTDPNVEPAAIVENGTVEWMDLELNTTSGSGDGEE
ncbi:hypothetical protein GJ631_13900 [Natronomonas sp. CBA1123]|jgi:plastocyanin|uniref:hypothetical protein n=1 Tax=Natronomonas sp. CBA1123 TaxID=2668070 RepID=UPI0012E9EE92|nr:hypothetical protein [Natronomonas sp. CBA1123]MUV87624.1 hypothetical protein [Natronomonas sp. CBA1123]